MSRSVFELRRATAKRLQAELPELDLIAARFEADQLWMHLLGVSRERLITMRNEHAEPEVGERLERALERRFRGEPLAYILGEQEFFSLPFYVSPAVLIPRPETEILVEQALKYLTPQLDNYLVIDVGIGSGAILLSLLHECRQRFGEEFLARGTWIGTDISRAALRVTRKNAERFRLQPFLKLLQGDLLSSLSLPRTDLELGLVVSNPPYIGEEEPLPRSVVEFEPNTALFAGKDGLQVIESLLTQAGSYLVGAEQAVLLFELGAGQQPGVDSLLNSLPNTAELPWRKVNRVNYIKDLQGLVRIAELIYR